MPDKSEQYIFPCHRWLVGSQRDVDLVPGMSSGVYLIKTSKRGRYIIGYNLTKCNRGKGNEEITETLKGLCRCGKRTGEQDLGETFHSYRFLRII